jgi:hypothetical protein
VDVGHAHASPSPLDRREDVGLIRDERGLLIEGEFEDSAAFFLCGEGSEDLVVEAEVGVSHVGALDGFRKLKGQAAEESYVPVGGHSCSFLRLGGGTLPPLIALE